MDRYRLPASYGSIGGLLVQQHLQAMQAMQAEAELQAEIARLLRTWTWKMIRGFVYLVGGVVALLYFNGGFAWTTAMTAGACVTGIVGLAWILWVGQTHPDYEENPILLIMLMAGGAHIAVLTWGWVAYGAATALPWLAIEFGVIGIVSGLMQVRKNLLF